MDRETEMDGRQGFTCNELVRRLKGALLSQQSVDNRTISLEHIIDQYSSNEIENSLSIVNGIG